MICVFEQFYTEYLLDKLNFKRFKYTFFKSIAKSMKVSKE